MSQKVLTSAEEALCDRAAEAGVALAGSMMPEGCVIAVIIAKTNGTDAHYTLVTGWGEGAVRPYLLLRSSMLEALKSEALDQPD